MKKYEFENKIKVMNAYGGKCTCCGDDNIYHLTIDHILNDGAKERREIASGGGKFYRYLLKNNCPQDKYQCLCFNCNSCIGYYGECYHNITISNVNHCPFCDKYLLDNFTKEFKVCDDCLNKIKGNNGKTAKNSKRTKLKLKYDIMKNYGLKCSSCGEDSIWFLSIDHIFGKDSSYKKGTKLYYWLKTNNYPKDKFQCLCYNCNCAKGFYNYDPNRQ